MVHFVDNLEQRLAAHFLNNFHLDTMQENPTPNA